MFLKRRKTKSVTPIVFKLSKKDSDRLKNNIRPSLLAFKNGTQTATDWHNLGFRLKVGVGVAEVLYVKENVDELQKCLNVIHLLKDRYVVEKHFQATKEELDLIEMGLDATDQMQDESTRRLLLDKFLEADKYMKALAGKEIENSF